MDSENRFKISKAYRTKTELEYMGGFFAEVLDEELRSMIPKGFSNVNLDGIILPELLEKINYVQKQKEILRHSLNGVMWKMGDTKDFEEWFTEVTLSCKNSSQVKKMASKLDESGIYVSNIEVMILYYLLGMDGKGERTPEELSQIRKFKSGAKYVSMIAKEIVGEEDAYELIKFSLEV